MKKVGFIIGARPQFIKHAPLELAMKKYFQTFSIHTGQHYDEKMSDIFFDQLLIQKPSYQLSIGSFSHGKQTGIMIEKIEEVLILEKPDAIVVYGDTNSTLAGAMAASKLKIKIIHVEAGLRSYNRDMPEEINRVLTDHLSNILFAPTNSAIQNLRKEGIHRNCFMVGDIMYDSLLMAKKLVSVDIQESETALVTLHRPYNTDNIERLKSILIELNELIYKVIFPIHPRTKNILNSHNINYSQFSNILFVDPVSYFELIRLQIASKIIITDSGGVQKEAYMLRKKCITLRSETEWEETLVNNWNTLIFDNLSDIHDCVNKAPGNYVDSIFGNGNTAVEIAKICNYQLN